MTSVVVPVEPTPEMWAAGEAAFDRDPDVHHETVVANIWEAMLAARPEAASVPGDAGAALYGVLFEMFREGPVDVAFAGNPHAIESLKRRTFAAIDAYESLTPRPKPPADLVRAVILATDDGDHHPPISQWAAERAVEVVMGEMAVRPTVGEGDLTEEVAVPRWAMADFLNNQPGWPDTARRYLNAPALRRPAPTVEEVARAEDDQRAGDGDEWFHDLDMGAR